MDRTFPCLPYHIAKYEVRNILSNAFGAVALIPSPWSAPAGITSGILGLISVLVSEQLSPGWYELPTPNGGFVYVYIGNNIIIS